MIHLVASFFLYLSFHDDFNEYTWVFKAGIKDAPKFE